MGDRLSARHDSGSYTVISFQKSISLTLYISRQPALSAALKVTKDLKLFEKWHDCGDVALGPNELAQLTSCDALLMRMSRPLN